MSDRFINVASINKLFLCSQIMPYNKRSKSRYREYTSSLKPVKLRQCGWVSFTEPYAAGTNKELHYTSANPSEAYMQQLYRATRSEALATSHTAGRVIMAPLDKMIGVDTGLSTKWGWRVHTYDSEATVGGPTLLEGFCGLPRGYTKFIAEYSQYYIPMVNVKAIVCNDSSSLLSVYRGPVRMPVSKYLITISSNGWDQQDYNQLFDHCNIAENRWVRPEKIGPYQHIEFDNTYNVSKIRGLKMPDDAGNNGVDTPSGGSATNQKNMEAASLYPLSYALGIGFVGTHAPVFGGTLYYAADLVFAQIEVIYYVKPVFIMKGGYVCVN